MAKITIKVGSNLLVQQDGQLDKRYIVELCREIGNLMSEGHQVVLVSSGARAAGYGYLNKSNAQEADLYMKQALCAVGQVQLMKLYESAMSFYGIKVAQILLTREDFSHRKRFLNLRNTLIGLTEMEILPIVNENDSVATEEIMFGDNDVLASMFAIGWNADYLLLMTSVDGVIDQNGKVIPFYREDTTNMAIAKNASSRWGSGGITSKIRAARAAAAAGIQTSICNGKKLENIAQFVLTGQTGTVFERVGPIKAKKAWIGFLSKPKGSIFINEGAKIAIENNRSLLPVGVVHIEGDFQAGDVVEIRLDDGTFLGKGIINFSSAEAKKIVGLKSDQLEDVLGYSCSKVLIHIDNLWKRDN